MTVIEGYFILVNFYVSQSTSWAVSLSLFDNNQNYFILTEATDGINYVLTPNMIGTHADTIEVVTVTDIMLRWGSPGTISTDIINFLATSSTMEVVFLMGRLWDLARIPIQNNYNLLFNKQKEFDEIDSNINNLKTAIAVITVATVLANAMSNRIEGRELKSYLSKS